MKITLVCFFLIWYTTSEHAQPIKHHLHTLWHNFKSHLDWFVRICHSKRFQLGRSKPKLTQPWVEDEGFFRSKTTTHLSTIVQSCFFDRHLTGEATGQWQGRGVHRRRLGERGWDRHPDPCQCFRCIWKTGWSGCRLCSDEDTRVMQQRRRRCTPCFPLLLLCEQTTFEGSDS